MSSPDPKFPSCSQWDSRHNFRDFEMTLSVHGATISPHITQSPRAKSQQSRIHLRIQHQHHGVSTRVWCCTKKAAIARTFSAQVDPKPNAQYDIKSQPMQTNIGPDHVSGSPLLMVIIWPASISRPNTDSLRRSLVKVHALISPRSPLCVTATIPNWRLIQGR